MTLQCKLLRYIKLICTSPLPRQQAPDRGATAPWGEAVSSHQEPVLSLTSGHIQGTCPAYVFTSNIFV